MKLTIILLSDDNNSIHPRELPWKDHRYEPWVSIFIEGDDDSFNYDLIHTDYLTRGNVTDNLFSKLCQLLTPEVKDRNSQYLKFHKFKVYNDLRTKLQGLLKGLQGGSLEINRNPKRLGDWDIKQKREKVEDVLQKIRKHEQVEAE